MGKKLISLALALALALAVPALAAEAPAFTDEKDIQHMEAVTALVTLGVMPVKPDGAFDPAGTMTRDQGARMLAVLMNGGDDKMTDSVKDEPSFPDIKDNWAESYIEYCADLGIVFAREDGKFDPEGDLTGFELLRMALAALGYDAKAYGLMGDKWKERTDELARMADPSLYTGLSGFAPGKPITRDDAAQILYNALRNKALKVVPVGADEKTGKVDWQYKLGDETLLQGRFGADSWQDLSQEDAVQDNAVQDNAIEPLTFTDAADIQHPEAVAALVKWGILRGKEDGSYFDPAGAITRAEAARMMSEVMHRDGLPKYSQITVRFSDCEGHWAEDYIIDCAQSGIINGKGDGTFAPGDKVTILTFAKMCLAMMGYKEPLCSLTGEQWAIETDILARSREPGLYTGFVGVDLVNTPLTRDEAAQILYNALQNKAMRYIPETVEDDDGIKHHQWRSETMEQTNIEYLGLDKRG